MQVLFYSVEHYGRAKRFQYEIRSPEPYTVRFNICVDVRY
jgi:hypothetical protein